MKLMAVEGRRPKAKELLPVRTFLLVGILQRLWGFTRVSR